jgi:hypothetical protein
MTIESPVGDVITNDTNAVTLYKDTQEYVTISNLRQNDGKSGTADTQSLSFDADSVIDDLAVGDITFTNAKINKGELSVSGTTYTVTIDGT